jgi:hypothetical protein
LESNCIKKIQLKKPSQKGSLNFVIFYGTLFSILAGSLIVFQDYLGDNLRIFYKYLIWLPASYVGFYFLWYIAEKKYLQYVEQNSEIKKDKEMH